MRADDTEELRIQRPLRGGGEWKLQPVCPGRWPFCVTSVERAVLFERNHAGRRRVWSDEVWSEGDTLELHPSGELFTSDEEEQILMPAPDLFEVKSEVLQVTG